ncbi:RNA polymerase sigma factor [Patescibacteria group bacterium]|nr:RNA polymerase sigma factor [Patescibacteria group bacterium]MBU1500858.1 RNA polymerase sigma factor [Patescibacteria group bacterium]MBU2080913.1 RNA polymerase sigma factor [Patescibacteria group bacterium]MBU2124018.1 RNA polymerase sigma factor [Patescibacteria group bacterium]MBU2194691.1 RNA polymerase sigma factor [Patescibacteria group bacterium]
MDQEDSKAYFLQIYDTYVSDIYRFCVLKVSSSELAEDLTQEVFTRFWQAIREGTHMRSERALLYTIARNLVIDWYRKKKEQSLDVLSEQGFEFKGDDATDIEDSAQVKEALSVIRQLDDVSREAVLMRYVEGLSPQDIAGITGDTANAVSVRINRAMKKVRAIMHTDETHE